MFVFIDEGIDNPGGGIVLTLGKAEAEMSVDFF